MNRNHLYKTITFLRERIEEYHEKILSEKIEWKEKEPYYLMMQEDILILEKLLGQGEKVVIRTKVEW